MKAEDHSLIKAKLHQIGGHTILAVADSDLIGCTLDNNGIKFCVNRSFYDGEFIAEEELLELIKSASSINIIGTRSMQVLIDNQIIREDEMVMIDGQPHVQIYNMIQD